MDKKVSNALVKIVEYRVLIPYLGDYKTGLHIREIARKLAMNHRTVKLALERLERQGVTRHEVSGRNKVYYLNSENPRTKDFIRDTESFRLGRVLDAPLTRELYQTLIRPPFPYNPVIVFGSYAKGDSTANSDIDLAILGNEGNMLEPLRKFELKYNKKVHVHVFPQKDFEKGIREKEPLFLEIVANHLILNNPDVFVDILWRHFYG